MVQAYPEFDTQLNNFEAEESVEWIKQFILGIRQIRGEKNIAPSKFLSVLVSNATQDDLSKIEKHKNFLNKLAKIESIEILNPKDDIPLAATALLGQMKLFVPLAGLIDAAAEIASLEKRLSKSQAQVDGLVKKLGNDKFVNSAPEAVVEKNKTQLSDAKQTVQQLNEQITTMQALL